MSPKALACPASLKGSLGATAAAAALKQGFAAAGIDADAMPIADGGEGTVDVLCSVFEEVDTVDDLLTLNGLRLLFERNRP